MADEAIDVAGLSVREPIRAYGEARLFESELDDNGQALFMVRMRCKVLLRAYESRVEWRHGERRIVQELVEKEARSAGPWEVRNRVVTSLAGCGARSRGSGATAPRAAQGVPRVRARGTEQVTGGRAEKWSAEQKVGHSTMRRHVPRTECREPRGRVAHKWTP